MRSIASSVTVLLLATIGTGVQAQGPVNDPPPNVAAGPAYTGLITRSRVEPALSSRSQLIPAVPLTEAPEDGRASKNLVVPGKDRQTSNDQLASAPHRLKGRLQSRTPSLVFDVNNSVSSPSDPAIAVGPEHVLIIFNTGFIIYDKDGNDLTGELSVDNIFSPNGCCDLTVSYDVAADRWVITYLLSSGAEIAVSEGPDPINTAWNIYSITQINDYQKLSVWSDGYYITDNNGSDNKVWALERAAMLNGLPNAGIQGFNLPGIVTSGFFSPQVLSVSNDDLPAAGGATVIYLQDDAWAGVADDHLKLWTINVDWVVAANSTVSAATELAATPFISEFDGGSFSNLTQPGGGDIDALQATVMYQAQFRKLIGHNSAVFNFVVDADGTAGELAAVRWYELQQPADNTAWSIAQEGTYTAPDGKHAWMASIMMDQFGNIGMGYTGMAGPATPNPTDFRVSSYYTGRFANDPPGTMTVAEESISAGTGDIDGFRYGDYSKIDIDPVNDKTFWFITEYEKNGSGADVVGVFQIASDFNDDVGVVSIDTPTDGALTNTEQVTVTVFNYGLTAASGFDVSYRVDGGAVITEPFAGILDAASAAQHTFATTSDLSNTGQTYTLQSYTSYTADQFNGNDTTSQNVTHLQAIDCGVTAISAPNTGTGLSATENVTVEIANFGSQTQTSVPVFYTVNGGAPVQAVYTGAFASGESVQFTFPTTADLSALGSYTIVAGTELVDDADQSNDDYTKVVQNNLCQPVSNCAGYNDGVTQLQLADQNIEPVCGTDPPGYSSEPNIVFNFVLADDPFQGSLQMGYDGSEYAIWIDFNDNSQFEGNELIASGTAAVADQSYPFTVTLSTMTGITSGMHLMRVRGTDGNNAEAPCDDMAYGRTNDYMANISGVVGLGADLANAANLSIQSLPHDQFLLTYRTSPTNEKLSVSIFDAKGRQLAFYTLTNNDGVYTRMLDMSYTSAGVYMVKIGSGSVNVVKRIVVE